MNDIKFRILFEEKAINTVVNITFHIEIKKKGTNRLKDLLKRYFAIN